MIAGQYVPGGFEQITVSNSVKTLTESKYVKDNFYAKKALITIESAQVRWTIDGTTPTSSIGHLNNPFDSITLIGTANIKGFKIIRAGATNAKISVTYSF